MNHVIDGVGMNELGRLALGIIVTLALLLAPAFTALWLVQSRKKAARSRRRSPLVTALLRSAGQTLRDKMEQMRLDAGMDLMLLMVIPTFPLVYFQIHSAVTGRLTSLWMLVAVTVPALAVVAWQVRKLVKSSAEMDKLRLGFDAEVAVGQELDHLMRDGAYVFHDVPAERFNIDHVVVARAGVFAVETKGYTKPNRAGGVEDATVVYNGSTLTLPDRSGAWAVDQARRQAQWLSKWLTSATGAPVLVTPVLAMPGWYVERKGAGDVLVFSGKELRGHLLKARAATPLQEDQFKRVVHQLDRQCRNVLPSYQPDPPER